VNLPKVWVTATKVPFSNFLDFSSFLSLLLKDLMSFGGIKCGRDKRERGLLSNWKAAETTWSGGQIPQHHMIRIP
jgi:hypothetical protein